MGNKSGLVLVLLIVVAVLAGAAGYVAGGTLTKMDQIPAGTIMSAELYQAEILAREAAESMGGEMDGEAAAELIRTEILQWLAGNPENLAALKAMTREEFELAHALTPELLAPLNEQAGVQEPLVEAVSETVEAVPEATE